MLVVCSKPRCHNVARCSRAAFSSAGRCQHRSTTCKAVVQAPVDATVATGLVFSTGESGAWDEAGVGSPVVRCFMRDDGQRWYMWYNGRPSTSELVNPAIPSTGSVGVALSKDGVSWQRGTGAVAGSRGEAGESDAGMVLEATASSGDWWTLDTCHVGVSDVQVFASASVGGGVGVYWMFYTGGDFEAVPAPEGMLGVSPGQPLEGLRMRPGLAMSQDGRNWARIEGEHHTHALFDVGEPGQWDSLYVANPKVLAAGPKDMRMYYSAFDPAARRFRVGLATSADGFRWGRQGAIFEGSSEAGAHDELGAASAHVVRDFESKSYFMFYEAVAADDTRSIGLAVSKDGRSGWQRLPRPLLAPSQEAGAWDMAGVGEPCAVSMSAGKWRLYYSGRAQKEGPWTGVGLALSAEGEQFAGAPTVFSRRAE